jgi:ubiquinone/menaquinone biosynthesis C-methylase UbiE
MPDSLNVSGVLDYLDLKEHMTAAEFGCGSADFTIALVKKLYKGKVYALDIQEEKLSALTSKLHLGKLNNVSMVLCDLEAPNGSTLQSNSLDVVLIPNVLFQAENKSAIIEEAKRILKSGGELLVIDWLKKAPFSPKEGMVSPDEVKKMTGQLGFSLKKEFAVGDYHYALLFTKK